MSPFAGWDAAILGLPEYLKKWESYGNQYQVNR
jgi:hypothetical protein